ncbi:uncharacterized protein LOC115956788 [Quercus lobata]|uniref:uncharacterized protein LOC115956788 n=1 Tax=Quercus lobata TaxID=97700 RepID=UPI0012459D6D|nr:uncharacterized protein LOC115956788 [Quercus lobata]
MKLLWKTIWGMKTLNKVQNFIWRACKDILATKTNLRKHHITSNDLCTSRNKAAETSGHMFWFYEKAKEVWNSSKMVFPFMITGNWEFIDIVWNVIKHTPKDFGMLEKTTMICWEIWKNRNVMSLEGAGNQGYKVLKKALNQVEDNRATHEKVLPQRDKEEIYWSAPREGRYKANVDGATFTKTQASGMGLVIRNNRGQVMVAMSRKIPTLLSALSVETKAKELAVEWMLEMSFKRSPSKLTP